MKKQLTLLILTILILPLVAQARQDSFVISVPFTPQAPLAEWHDQRQQDGCEEAVVAMAMAWIGDEENISKENWRLRILILSDFEWRKIGEYRDVSLEDIQEVLFRKYFGYKDTRIEEVNDAQDIITELEKGRVILTPMDGRLLGNPYFNPPGPGRHMILIKGYDYDTNEFIVNDPGTRRGDSFKYHEDVLFEAIREYPTGYHEKIDETEKRMIVVGK